MTPAALTAAVALALSPVDFAGHYAPRGHWTRTKHQQLIGDAIADCVFAGKLAILIIECPPQHGKSAIVSQWTPAWYLSLFPARRAAVVSYEAGVAARWGRWVRDTLDEIGTVELASDSKARDEWSTVHGGGMITVGVGGPLTSYGVNLMVIDDPIKNAEEADSETIREKVWDWFQTTAWTRKQPGTVFVLMHTRWHQDDLVGRVLAHPEMARLVTRIRLPALAEDNDALGRRTGEALWPSRYPADDSPDGLLTTQRVLSPRWWNALYQQRPTSAEGQEVKRDWWKWYDELPVQREALEFVALSADCAFRETTESDFVVIQAWGIYGAQRYLLDQVRQRIDFVGTCEQILLMSKQWKPNATLVEAKANGDAVLSTLSGIVTGLVPIEPQGGKLARARAAAPQIRAGDVYLPKLPWAAELVEEWAAFPLGKNDDQVDATSQFLNYAVGFQSVPLHDLQPSDNRWVPPHLVALQERGVLGGLGTVPKNWRV